MENGIKKRMIQKMRRKERGKMHTCYLISIFAFHPSPISRACGAIRYTLSLTLSLSLIRGFHSSKKANNNRITVCLIHREV